MNSGIAWVIVGGLGLLLYMQMKKTDQVAQVVQMTPNPTGGTQADSPAKVFNDITQSIAKLIDSGIAIADRVDRN